MPDINSILEFIKLELLERRKRPLIGILLFFVVLGAVFLLRSPVLIVTDASFDQLYGSLRLREERARLSHRLFRRVIPVTVTETAGPDLVALAAAGASKSAKLVIFPYRYLEGAEYYTKNSPKTPVLVMEGTRFQARNSSVGDFGLVFARINTEEDLYRAGLCAALLADGEQVVFISDETLPGEYRDAFREGLRAQGHLKDPVYLNSQSDFSPNSEGGCAVLAGSAGKFLEQSSKIPIILFSWIDPGLTPRTVKIIFDDSPWALAAELIRKFPSREGEIFVSSKPFVFPDRIDDKRDFRKIRGKIKEKLQKN